MQNISGEQRVYPESFFLDKEEVAKLKESYLSQVDFVERKLFHKGYQAEIGDILNHLGPSNN